MEELTRLKNSKVIVAGVVIAFILSIYLIIVLERGGSFAIDSVLTDFIQGIFPHSSYSFFEFLSNFGDKIGIGIVAIIFIIWLAWKKRDFHGIAAFVIAIGLGNEFNKVIKEAIARPRPTFNHFVDESSMSFPSGHAMVGLILYMFIAHFLAKEAKSSAGKGIIAICALLFVLLIGISRIVLGFHYPTDIIGGYLIGSIWLFLWISLYERFANRKKERNK